MAIEAIQIESERIIIKESFKLLLLALFPLIASHFIHMPILFWITYFIVFLVYLNQNYFVRSKFTFVTIVFVCNHFIYFQTFGNMWGSFPLFIVVILYIMGKKKYERINHDIVIDLLITIFIATDLLGIFISPLPLKIKFYGTISFFSLITMFYISKNLILTEYRHRSLILVFIFISFYSFIVTLNSGIGLLKLPIPLLTWNPDYFIENRFWTSMVGRVSPEHGVMLFQCLFPYLLYSKFTQLKIKKSYLFIGVISAGLIGILGFTKTHWLLMFTITPLQLIVMNISKLRIWKQKITLNQFVIFTSILVMFLSFFIDFGFIIERYKQNPENLENMIKDPISGVGTSREGSFDFALKRIKSKNWLLGYGWSTDNRMTWFGVKIIQSGQGLRKLDFHNLYYSIIPIFGWIGSAVFLLIIFVSIIRLYLIIINKKYQSHYLYPFAWGFFFLFITFIISEYTANATLHHSYFLLIWILLGFANSIYYTIVRSLRK